MNRLIVPLRRRIVPINLQGVRFVGNGWKKGNTNENLKDSIVQQVKEPNNVDFSRTFDALDSSSMKTMEKILDILHDAEEKSDSNKTKSILHGIETIEDTKYLNDFTTKFGEEIFQYKVIRYLNDREIIADKPSIWGNIPAVYDEYVQQFTNEYLDMKKSFFKQNDVNFNGSLNHFQSIAKYFVENDTKCLQKISRELEILEKYQSSQSFSKKKYNFPKLSLPPPYPFDSENPLIIMKALSTKKELNLLPFIINDPDVIENLITRNQILHNNEVTPPKMILSLMEAQELEGSILFTIIVKKCLYTSNQLNNQIIIDAFLNNESIKSSVASESRIPSRLFSYNNYKLALSRSNVINIEDDETILDLLKSQFNRFFGLFYRISAFEADKWTTKLIDYYLAEPPFDSKKMSINSIEYFKKFISDVEMHTNNSKWARKWELKRQGH